MSDFSVFDILGPIMIGPSSSHTAGAARLGNVAASIVGGEFDKVIFYLHGSFANTYKGHGTDKALAAGVLGMKPDDERLRNSLAIAAEKGVEIEFEETDLGDCHENTVKIDFFKKNGETHSVTGSSIGGGNIMITDIDGFGVEITGMTPTLIIRQHDKKGVISSISTVLAKNDINIAVMKLKRKKRGDEATTIIEIDGDMSKEVIECLRGLDNIIEVKYINPQNT